MPVDKDTMPAAQRAAWDRLWRILLTPETQETRNGGSLVTDTATGKERTVETAPRRNHATNRGGQYE